LTQLPVLIICPASILQHWSREFLRVCWWFSWQWLILELFWLWLFEVVQTSSSYMSWTWKVLCPQFSEEEPVGCHAHKLWNFSLEF
jgi:hypothetical protein